ncbi:hypothetical protein [Leeia sp.]|uniref:hypothetical protein n=1 Tax=Leeia sp. TaxID=2884678 RepID=UPI0035B25E98
MLSTFIMGWVRAVFHFTYRARTPEGRALSGQVTASDDAAARATLAQRGYLEIELHESTDTAPVVHERFSRPQFNLTATEEARLHPASGLWMQLGRVSLRQVAWWGPLAGWLLLALLFRHPLDWAHGVPAIALLGYAVWFLWSSLPEALYRLALFSAEWGDWSASGRWLRRLMRLPRGWLSTPLPRQELDFRLAMAEAGQGRLQQALDQIDHYARDAALGPARYLARVATIHHAAGDYRGMLLRLHEAHILAPTSHSRLDLALVQVRWGQNPQAARKLLDEVDESRLEGMASLCLHYSRGLIALNTGHPRLALPHLELAMQQACRQLDSPPMCGLLLDMRAHYALALLALGERKLAKQHLSAIRDWLKAKGDKALMRRCKQALSAGRSVPALAVAA